MLTKNASEIGNRAVEMISGVSDREKYGLTGLFAVSLIAAFGAGTFASGSNSPTGAFMEGTGGETSQEQIKERVESLMSQQVQQQRQQLKQVANQSENLTMEDLSINSQVESVSRSQFNSLYEVNVSTTGEVPQQLGDGTRSIDQIQTFYISNDGRYLFQEPTDLEQPQQTQQRPQAPTGEQ